MAKTNEEEIIDLDNWQTESFNFDDPNLHKLLDEPVPPVDNSRLRTNAQHAGFDNNTGDTWIYPNNLPLRTYQMNITHAALYRNTLVVLPTGLGKTFIAAVVMYNIYRWYPRAKLIFMAPTRPLVAQQIEACQRIMPFPNKDTVEMTGKLPRSCRMELWRTKRVFFATPQVVQSDIAGDPASSFDGDVELASSSMTFPFAEVKLLVVDEAHKAKGRYAYTEVVQAIGARNRYFRVLALSATPGRSMEDVAEVVRNLFISHLEIRCDTSLDVAPFVHKRSMKTIVVSLGEDIQRVREELITIIDPYLRQLNDAGVLNSATVNNPTKNGLLFEQKRFRDRSMREPRPPQQANVNSNFSICISLYHALELLERHGMRVFLNYFEVDEEGRAKFVLRLERRLRELIERLRLEIGPNPFDVSVHAMTNGEVADMPSDLDFGHPKFEKARECLLQHFESQPESRAIVFCEYRESVMLMYRLLLQHKPVLRARCFVGQGGSNGPLRALTQKQQIQIMADFREGKSNILIATCIGEEGIDVGEVDLIVCFDISTSNPTRFVQRIGRTGRCRQGSVVMLVTEGREQQLLRDVVAQKDQTNRRLLTSNVVKSALYRSAPRLVPTELQPQCVHTFIKPPKEDEAEKAKGNTIAGTPEKGTKRAGRAGKGKAVPVKGTQDLRRFFKERAAKFASSTLETIDVEAFEAGGTQVPNSPTQEGGGTQQRARNDESLRRINRFCEEVQAQLQLPTNTQLLATQAQKRKEPRNTERSPLSEEEVEIVEEEAAPREKDLLQNQTKKPVPPSHVEKEEPLLAAEIRATSTPSPPAPTPPPNIIVRFRRANKFIQNPKANLLPTHWLTDIRQQLCSKTLSNVGKQIILKQHPHILRDVLEKINILEALAEADDEEGAMSAEEHETREFYAIIERACGGTRQSVDDFLLSIEVKLEERRASSFDPWAGLRGGQATGDDQEAFDRRMDEMFKDLEGYQGRRWRDNYKFMQTEYERIQNEAEVEMETLEGDDERPSTSAAAMGESMIYDTIGEGNWSEDFTLAESKYSHQFKDEKEQAEKASEETGASLSTASIGEGNNTGLSAATADDCNSSSFLQKLAASPVNPPPASDWQNAGDDDFLVLTCERAEAAASPAASQKKQLKETAGRKLSSTPAAKEMKAPELQQEFDGIDLAAFLDDPFPEEESSAMTSTTSDKKVLSVASPFSPSPSDSLKENVPARSGRNSQLNLNNRQDSPDLFETSHVEVPPPALTKKLPKQAKQLATPLAKPQQSMPNLMNGNLARSSTPHAHSSNALRAASALALPSPLISPKRLALQPSPQLLKSPSIFDMYLRRTNSNNCGGQTPTSPLACRQRPTATITSGQASAAANNTNNNNTTSTSLADASVIAPLARNTKRRIIESDSDKDDFEADVRYPMKRDDITPLDGTGSETDCEEVLAQQQQQQQQKLQRHSTNRPKKRRRLNAFIDDEANVSEAGESEDEIECTQAEYEALRSMMRCSDEISEEEEDIASKSHMQGVYLQSLKSPMQRRGTFKIPTGRVYNDCMDVYSQTVPLEPSQYMLGSFIVNEADSRCDNDEQDADESICPLERAERILKERRRARRHQAQSSKATTSKVRRGRRVMIPVEESDDENSDS